ncbi:MAG TPA: hypothetical protein VK570_16540 [Rubrivivax sp.]|nr:hypothetical protein [Rubrivivax sp.]
MTHPVLMALALLLTTQTLAASAEIVEIEWAADGAFELQRSLPAGKLLEACTKLPAGARVDWGYKAARPLDFNIHYHVGQQVVYPKRLKRSAAASGTLAVELEQDYCWMWTNKNKTAASLSLSLARKH